MKSPKHKITLLFMFSFSYISHSQNLVGSNYSFEQYDTCPNMEDQIKYATGWSKYSYVTTTPDYYNACAPVPYFTVPDNSVTYQLAHRNCSAYSGVVTFFTSLVNYREQIGIQLEQPLTIGQKYFISFYTVMSDNKKNGDYYFEMPSNNIGIRLSTVAYNESNPAPIDNFAHLRSIPVITDSINWNRISGSIISDSVYNYLIVGNFFNDANTVTLNNSCDSCLNNYSYYLVDDICLSTDSLFCNGGIDLLPCNVSVNEITSNNEIKIFPNPFNNYIVIESGYGDEQFEIKIFDSLGRNILQKNVFSHEHIQLNHFVSGIYFIHITSSTNKYSNFKIIKL